MADEINGQGDDSIQRRARSILVSPRQPIVRNPGNLGSTRSLIREGASLFGSGVSESSMTLLALRVFNELRRPSVPTLPNIRGRVQQPLRDALLSMDGVCGRCEKKTLDGPHECTWTGGPRPIGLSRERINIQSIDKRIMVRQWAMEGAKTRRTASKLHRQQGRHMIDSYTKGRAFLCVGSAGGEDRLVVMFDEALRHEAEQWVLWNTRTME